jgi:hypothetical protein
VNDSYKSLGNNGECYNQSITSCIPDNEVPADVIRSIYYMSDHIPVVCELSTPLTLSVQESSRTQLNLHFPNGNVFNENISFTVDSKPGSSLEYRVYNASGSVMTQFILVNTGQNEQILIPSEHFAQGIYFIYLIQDSIVTTTAKIAVTHP